MPDRWVVNDEYPEGHVVPMTAEEEAQLERDQAVMTSLVAAQARAESEESARIADLRKARIELATGVIFSSFTPSERTVLDLLLADSAQAR